MALPICRALIGTFRAAYHGFLSLTYDNIGRSNREDENTVLKELVPIEACLNSSKAGLSGFWSSAVRYNRSL